MCVCLFFWGGPRGGGACLFAKKGMGGPLRGTQEEVDGNNWFEHVRGWPKAGSCGHVWFPPIEVHCLIQKHVWDGNPPFVGDPSDTPILVQSRLGFLGGGSLPNPTICTRVACRFRVSPPVPRWKRMLITERESEREREI